MNARVRALIQKEMLDLLRNRGALIPVVAVAIVALVLPFVVVIVVPAATGQQLGNDDELVRLSAIAGVPEGISDNARVQLFHIHVPIVGHNVHRRESRRRGQRSSC